MYCASEMYLFKSCYLLYNVTVCNGLNDFGLGPVSYCNKVRLLLPQNNLKSKQNFDGLISLLNTFQTRCHYYSTFLILNYEVFETEVQTFKI